jgi:hypothetical protein
VTAASEQVGDPDGIMVQELTEDHGCSPYPGFLVKCARHVVHDTITSWCFHVAVDQERLPSAGPDEGQQPEEMEACALRIDQGMEVHLVGSPIPMSINNQSSISMGRL